MRIKYFDINDGVTFRLSNLMLAITWALGLPVLLIGVGLIISLVKTFSWVTLVFGVLAVILGAILIIASRVQLHIDATGITYTKMMAGAMPRLRILPWDMIDKIDYSVKIGKVKTHVAEITLKDVTKDHILIPLTRHNADSQLVYRIMLAYLSHSRGEEVDWNSLMRKEGENEPIFATLMYSAGVFLFAALFTFVALQIYVSTSFDGWTYNGESEEVYEDYDRDQQVTTVRLRDGKALYQGEVGQFVRVKEFDSERDLLIMSVGQANGVYSYKENRWIIAPQTDCELRFYRGYIAGMTGDEKDVLTKYYSYSGKESFFVKAFSNIALWLSPLLGLLVAVPYFRWRRQSR